MIYKGHEVKGRKARHAEQKSMTPDYSDAAMIRWLKDMGFHGKRISALFDLNQGRITDIVDRFPGAKSEDAEAIRILRVNSGEAG